MTRHSTPSPKRTALGIALLIGATLCFALLDTTSQYVGPAVPVVMAVWLRYLTQTLMTTLAGFALAVIVGMVLGLAVGASPVIHKATYPLLVGFNSIPKVGSSQNSENKAR